MGKLIFRFVGGGLFILLASATGFAFFFYSKAHVTPKHVTLTAQIQFELDAATQMKNEVTLTPRSEDPDGIIDVRVDYGASPPETQRALMVRDTNMVVRRHIPHLGDLKINFADPKPTVTVADPASDAGVGGIPGVDSHPPVADPGKPPPGKPTGLKPTVTAAPEPAKGLKPTVTAAPDAPKGNGLVTIVTFPEATVAEGSHALGKTPLFKLKLPAGTHLLTLAGPDGKKHQLSVPVVAGNTRAFKVNLDDLPAR